MPSAAVADGAYDRTCPASVWGCAGAFRVPARKIPHPTARCSPVHARARQEREIGVGTVAALAVDARVRSTRWEVLPMFASRLLMFAAALTLALPASATGTRQGMTAQELREYRAVSRFLRAVDDYVLTHRIVSPVPPELMCLPDGAVAVVNDLAAIPIDARPAPREGDIFALDVADTFRDRIARAVRQHEINVWDLVDDMNEDEMVAPPVRVNEQLPWGVGGRSIQWLASALPVLPEQIEYKLIGRDLVLFDTRDGIVVDVLRVALPMY
jgi:hypothetical protein